jgi:hypothetical protein
VKGQSSLESCLCWNAAESEPSRGDILKELLFQFIRVAFDIVKDAQTQFSNDELQKLATTLFIQRTRLA